MRKILMIGDSLPLFSYRAAMTLEMAGQLRSRGNEVYLLSKAWCRATETTFYGDVSQLSDPCPFRKRFFVDPLQLRESKAELMTSMLGLALLTIDEEKIDCVVFSDDVSLLPLVEMIRTRRKLPCFLYLFDMARIVSGLLDDYMMPILPASLQAFDAIFAFPGYKNLLVQMFGVKEAAVIPAAPIPCAGLSAEAHEIPRDRLYVLVEAYSERSARLAVSVAKQELGDRFEKILACTPGGAADAERLSLAADQCVKPEQIPRGAAVVIDGEMVGRKGPAWDQYLLLLQKGWAPIIARENLASLADYTVAEVPVGSYHMLTELRFPWADAAEAAAGRFPPEEPPEGRE